MISERADAGRRRSPVFPSQALRRGVIDPSTEGQVLWSAVEADHSISAIQRHDPVLSIAPHIGPVPLHRVFFESISNSNRAGPSGDDLHPGYDSVLARRRDLVASFRSQVLESHGSPGCRCRREEP